MNQYVFNAITDILKTAIDLNGIGHSLFVEYSPHVYSLDLRLHIGGWIRDRNPDFVRIIYLDDAFYDRGDSAKEIIKRLHDANKEINKLCKVKNVTENKKVRL